MEPDSSRYSRYHILILFLTGFLLYANTLTHDYVLDDVLVITGNKFTKMGIAGIPDIITHDLFIGAYGEALNLSGGRYRPLSIATFAVEYELFGFNPFIGHLINTALFGLICILIYLFLKNLAPDSYIPLIASLLFAAHPIHTEVVANIKSRDEILALLFVLLVLIFCLKDSGKFILTGTLFFFLALLSKESAVTILAVIPLALFLFGNVPVRKITLKMLPYLAVTGVYIALRAKFAGTLGDRETTDILDNPFVFATFSQRLATVTLIAGKYIALLFFPYSLSYDYSYNEIPLTEWSDWRVLLTLAAIGFLIFLSAKHIFYRYKESLKGISINVQENLHGNREQTVKNRPQGKRYYRASSNEPKRFKTKTAVGPYGSRDVQPDFPAEAGNRYLIAFGILFYFFSYSIVSNLFFNIGTNMGERFVFTPSLGFCIAVSGAVAGIRNFRNLLNFGSLIFILLAAGWTVKRNGVWKNNFTLYEHDVKVAPNSARTHLYYGVEMIGKYEKDKNESTIRTAISEIKQSCRIAPAFHHAWYNLGIACQSDNRHDSAIACFNKVLELQPLHIKSHYCLGVSYGKGKGDMDKAIYYLEKAMSYNYRDAECYDNLGIAYAMKGNFHKAVEIFTEGIRKFPQTAQLYLNLGTTYANKGDMKTAEEYFKKARELDPALKGKR